MVLKATINQSHLSTQTIPEIFAPQACTHFPYSFWSGEFCIIVFLIKTMFLLVFIRHF